MPERPIGTALKAVAGRDVSRGFESRPLCRPAVNVSTSRKDVVSTSRYHLARGASMLAFGGSSLLCGGAYLSGVVLERITDGSAGWVALRAVLLVLAVVFLVGLLRALWRLVRPPVALRMDTEGYSMARSIGSGIRAAGWQDVERVELVTSGRSTVVVVRLHSGATTQIPARLVEEPLGDWTAELDERLNTAHGQRRL